MKFLQVHTFYDAYLQEFYARRPELAKAGYHQQINALHVDAFAGSHMFAPYLPAVGYETELIIANCLPLQLSWLAENLPGAPIPRQIDMHRLVLNQVEHLRPDILYLTDPIAFDSRFVRELSYRPRFVFGWRAASVPEQTDWSAFDLIISNSDHCLDLAFKHGAKDRAFFVPGFPPHVARAVAQEEKKYDVVFTGQVSGEHAGRRDMLSQLSRAVSLSASDISLAFFIPGPADNLDAFTAKYNHGQVWGMDMFRTLRQGRISLNAQIDLGDKQAGNMRLFETTGAGSFMLTDYHHNISDYFEPGREIETYRSQGELVEKIQYYLAHPAEREEIARRGQERCLKEYSMEQRAQQLDVIIRGRLASKQPREALAEDVATLKGQAAKLLKEGRVAGAFDLLVRAKALKTPHQGLDVLRANCFIAMGQLMAAKQTLLEELRFFPDNQAARQMLDGLASMETPDETHFDFDPEFQRVLAVVRPYSMLGELRLYSLFQLAKHVCQQDIPGNFAECGVAAGGSSALLAYVIKNYSRSPRILYSFDSFSGMPEPGENDVELGRGLGAEETGWGTGTCAAPVDSLLEVAQKLGVLHLVKPVKGYYEDTLPKIHGLVGGVAFIHIDSDWYESTRTILDNFYDQIHDQAIIQFDDYGYWKGCGKALHEFEQERGLSFSINNIDGNGVWFKKA